MSLPKAPIQSILAGILTLEQKIFLMTILDYFAKKYVKITVCSPRRTVSCSLLLSAWPAILNKGKSGYSYNFEPF